MLIPGRANAASEERPHANPARQKTVIPFSSRLLAHPSPRAAFWADSVMKTLTPEKMIAQLMMVRTYSNRDDDFNNSIDQLITRFGIGGLCFFQGDAERQTNLTRDWQSCSEVPLFIAMDAENGPGLRLKGAFLFPDFMTLGALTNDNLTALAGYRTGLMCRSLGVHINFSPVADVNNNPLNPVIHLRSFGESPDRVAQKATAFARGLQDAGVIATAKHFPGHGDTDADSHYTLPVLKKTHSQLASTELIPFTSLIKNQTGAVMVAHLTLPLIDTTPQLAATFSRPIVKDLLADELGFTGLIITDGLDMKGATLGLGPGIPALKAFEAGADILLLPSDVEAAICALQEALADTVITLEMVEQRCRRVLIAKYYAIVASCENNSLHFEADPAGEPFDEALNRQILKESATLVRNHHQVIPFRRPDTLSMAVVNCGLEEGNPFTDRMNCYTSCPEFSLPTAPDKESIDGLVRQLAAFNLVILNVVSKNLGAGRDYGIAPGTSLLHQRLADSGMRTAVIVCGSPYGASRIARIDAADVVVVTPDRSSDIQEIIPQLLFGAIPFKGILPVTIEGLAACGFGIKTKTLERLRYVAPSELGISRKDIAAIDTVALEGLRAGAYPGCQIVLAVGGNVFYRRAFGTLDPGSKIPVKCTDLYDLASLTKILATTPAVMKLNENKLVDIKKNLSAYLPLARRHSLSHLKILDILTHQAGLQPWIPFYQKLLEKPDRYFADSLSAEYQMKVADRIFLRTDYRDSILDQIARAPLHPKQGYKYSDLGFILLKEAVEKVTQRRFDQWLDQEFYKPLSLNSLGFKPWVRFSPDRIAPTENDTLWRKQWLRGYVHDQAAALMGGVAGHAGLFGNANDVSILMQMWLQGGSYGGQRFFEKSTIERFTSRPVSHKNNRRALGFDKPLPDRSADGPVCPEASPTSFGHSGFTGTYTWADPANQLVYTFLSNRVCPDASNATLVQMNIRTRIHSLAYKAVESARKPILSGYSPPADASVLSINFCRLGLLISTWH